MLVLMVSLLNVIKLQEILIPDHRVLGTCPGIWGERLLNAFAHSLPGSSTSAAKGQMPLKKSSKKMSQKVYMEFRCASFCGSPKMALWQHQKQRP